MLTGVSDHQLSKWVEQVPPELLKNIIREVINCIIQKRDAVGWTEVNEELIWESWCALCLHKKTRVTECGKCSTCWKIKFSEVCYCRSLPHLLAAYDLEFLPEKYKIFLK